MRFEALLWPMALTFMTLGAGGLLGFCAGVWFSCKQIRDGRW